MTLTATTPTTQVEKLAKLYLKGKPAEISDEAIAQLCDWLIAEFQQLLLNLQFSDYMRYADAQEMFDDIERGQLWVAADSYDSTLYPNPIYGQFQHLESRLPDFVLLAPTSSPARVNASE